MSVLLLNTSHVVTWSFSVSSACLCRRNTEGKIFYQYKTAM